jgi:hypothetical protein
MNTFKTGDRIVFRESENGAPEPGEVIEVIPPDDQYPMGGLYIIRTDEPAENGYHTEAFWTELTPEHS